MSDDKAKIGRTLRVDGDLYDQIEELQYARKRATGVKPTLGDLVRELWEKAGRAAETPDTRKGGGPEINQGPIDKSLTVLDTSLDPNEIQGITLAPDEVQSLLDLLYILRSGQEKIINAISLNVSSFKELVEVKTGQPPAWSRTGEPSASASKDPGAAKSGGGDHGRHGDLQRRRRKAG